MSLRFIRRVKLLPWVTLNFGKNGFSISFGPRGAKFTIGQGGKSASFGAPGTGLSYRKNKKTKHGDKFKYPWIK